jgi:hypothetical protein
VNTEELIRRRRRRRRRRVELKEIDHHRELIRRSTIKDPKRRFT